MTTAIQWTDETWNAVRGCSRVSAGCDHCYAMGQARRFSGPGKPYEGLTTIRRGKVDWTGGARFVPEMLAAPLKWKAPKRIFVNSMSDLFHESLSNEEIAAIFGVMAACPQHTFQVLTKRPERMKEWFEWVAREVDNHDYLSGNAEDIEVRRCVGHADQRQINRNHIDYPVWPLPNVHLGVSVEDQATADKRVPLLLETPAAVRFVSAEPLLGPVDLAYLCFNGADSFGTMPGLHWVIVGGESGPGARGCNVEWLRSIVRQCKAAAVPVFTKQMGAKPFQEVGFTGIDQCAESIARHGEYDPDPDAYYLNDKKGADPSEWPEDLRVREFPKGALCPEKR